MAEKPKTVTEQLLARRLARKPFSEQTPGDVLLEAFHEWDPSGQEFVRDDSGPGKAASSVTLDGHFDLDEIARRFLHKVMASG